MNLFDKKFKHPHIEYISSFLCFEKAWRFFSSLKKTLVLKQEKVKIMGRTLLQPRLQAWYADNNISYTYSGLKNKASPWTKELLFLREMVSKKANCQFNSVFVNLYRDGQDSLGYHADDEKELGPHYPNNVVIASLSLGSKRKFLLKRNRDSFKKEYFLGDGDLLIMKGDLQQKWKHSIPKTKKPIGERMNLTFRVIKS